MTVTHEPSWLWEVWTSRGRARVVLLMDHGPDAATLLMCVDEATGELWWEQMSRVRWRWSETWQFGRRGPLEAPVEPPQAPAPAPATPLPAAPAPASPGPATGPAVGSEAATPPYPALPRPTPAVVVGLVDRPTFGLSWTS